MAQLSVPKHWVMANKQKKPFIWRISHQPAVLRSIHCKKVCHFPVPSRDVTNQTLSGREKLNYSRPGRVWSVTSRLETGKRLTLFYSVDENETVQERGWRPKVWLRSKGLKIYIYIEGSEMNWNEISFFKSLLPFSDWKSLINLLVKRSLVGPFQRIVIHNLSAILHFRSRETFFGNGYMSIKNMNFLYIWEKSILYNYPISKWNFGIKEWRNLERIYAKLCQNQINMFPLFIKASL